MANNTDTKTVSQGEQSEMTKTTIAIPADLHKAVKIAGIERGMDAQDIYVEAVRKYLQLPVA